jgi:hypothetical protein
MLDGIQYHLLITGDVIKCVICKSEECNSSPYQLKKFIKKHQLCSTRNLSQKR